MTDAIIMGPAMTRVVVTLSGATDPVTVDLVLVSITAMILMPAVTPVTNAKFGECSRSFQKASS